jgi:hypothetical protein
MVIFHFAMDMLGKQPEAIDLRFIQGNPLGFAENVRDLPPEPMVFPTALKRSNLLDYSKVTRVPKKNKIDGYPDFGQRCFGCFSGLYIYIYIYI